MDDQPTAFNAVRSDSSPQMHEMNGRSHVPCRILITGATGQFGQALMQSCPPDFKAIGLTRGELDLSDLNTLKNRLDARIATDQPEFLINAAAYTAVDLAESEIEQAWRVNAVAPGVLAAVAARHQIPLLHYSTDYVFDGTQTDPYLETDPTNPLSVYGRSKLAGERAVEAVNGLGIILRTSWVFSAYRKNFLKTMLQLGAQRDQLSVVSDQIGAPTSAHWLADATYAMLRVLRNSAEPAQYQGCYHMTAQGFTSWHGYAQYVLNRARSMGFKLRVSSDGVQMLTTAQYPTPASRPRMGRLNTARLQTQFGIAPDHWESGVDDVLERLRPCES